MANTLYSLGRQGFLDGSYSWTGNTIKALLATSGYSPNTSSDQFVSTITSGNIVARSSAFSSKTATSGVANASNVTFTAVTGSAVSYIVIYYDTGSDSTARLIALIDTASGLPVTPNGGDITIEWDTGSNKIFTL